MSTPDGLLPKRTRCVLGDRVAAFRQFAAACCAGASCYVKRVGDDGR